jgi:hypothetical protein
VLCGTLMVAVRGHLVSSRVGNLVWALLRDGVWPTSKALSVGTVHG